MTESQDREISMDSHLKEIFKTGKGSITIDRYATDDEIIKSIRNALKLSEGESFKVHVTDVSKPLILDEAPLLLNSHYLEYVNTGLKLSNTWKPESGEDAL